MQSSVHNRIPDRYEHLVRYYGYYSNRSRGTKRLAEQGGATLRIIALIDDADVTDRS